MITKDQVEEALLDVYDPELDINIVDLGLVYGIDVDENENVTITMTLTTPGCPMHDSINTAIHNRLGLLEGIGEISVKLVWQPPWNPSMISERAKAILWG